MSIRQSIFALFATALLAASCATATPRSFERVVDKAETDGASYSEQDWAAADAQYEEFMEKYSDMETLRSLTPEKRKEVGRLAARYLKVRTRVQMQDMQDALEVGSDLTKGFLDELGLTNMDSIESQMHGFEALMQEFESLFEIDE